jgi:hypothetical protein
MEGERRRETKRLKEREREWKRERWEVERRRK